MKVSVKNISSIVAPIIIILHLFSVGQVSGIFAGKAVYFSIILFAIALFLQLRLPRQNTYFVIGLFIFLTVKTLETIGQTELDRLSNTAFSLTVIAGLYKFIDLKKFKIILFYFLVINSLIMTLQMIGLPTFHLWNTLIDESIRLNSFNNVKNIKELAYIEFHTLRPPGIFYSQAINSAFVIGTSFIFLQERSTIITLLTSTALLLCGSKSALLLLVGLNVYFVVRFFLNLEKKIMIKLLAGVLPLLLYVLLAPIHFFTRYGADSFLVSAILRFYAISEWFGWQIFGDVSRLGGTKLTSRSDISNFGVELLALLTTLVCLSVISPHLRRKVKRLLFIIYPLLYVNMITSVTGSLVTYFLIMKRSK